jgi:D-alanine-D-alanine ligase
VNVAVLFDGASAFGGTPDQLILGTVASIEESLAAEGNTVTRVGVNTDGKWIEKIRRGKFDLAFNMCEGIDGVSSLEPAVISVLELFGIPFTGSSSYTAAVCLRKHVVNTLLDRAGLPVPRFGLVRRGSSLPAVGFPAICKPAAEDASLGIEQRSVARSARALAQRVEAMLESWEEVLVQRYVDGREVNVGILGDTVLPISEIDFGAMPAGKWHIVSYQSKWATGSEEDIGTAPRCPAKLPAKLASEVRRIALSAWRLVGGTGYGRVDMRIDVEGRPWILEVNANPDIAADAGLARMAEVAGMTYASLIREICELGLARTFERAEPAGWALAQKLSGVLVDMDRYPLELFATGET